MPPLPQARHGQRLQVKRRPVGFSFWPSRRARRHHRLQSLLFALDPWTVIARSIETDCATGQQSEALSTLEQARDFFVASTQSGIVAARPLALYYSYMNLAKAFCLTRGIRPSFDQAKHGMSERLRGGGRELTDAYLDAFPNPANGNYANIFADFMHAITGTALPAHTQYEMPFLLPQVLSGHRLWAQASGKPERFIALHDIQFWTAPHNHEIWLRLYLMADDLTRLGITHQRLLLESGLTTSFREVRCEEKFNGRDVICLEQANPQNYANDYPADHLLRLVSSIRSRLWSTVSTVPPYRRFYVYLCPQIEEVSLLPQLPAVYAITFYLGSITRYRPHHYDLMVRSAFGPRIQDFVTGQPLQFLYLMASEFAKQDITKPSIL